jgi:hypothetical protein
VQESVLQAHTIHGDVHLHERSRDSAIALPYRVGVVPPRTGFFQNRSAFELPLRVFGGVNVTGSTSAGESGVLVLSGLGGVGKTQLAVDYAERMWSAGAIDLLVWVTAGSVDAIVSGYARAAAALTGVEVSAPEQGAQRFLEWLAGTAAHWLVVLDDLRSPADLAGLWPPASASGQVLVTTRRADAAMRGNGRQLIRVGGFALHEACSYLEVALAGRPRLLDGEAAELARDLGYLPLALAQAVAYLIDRNLTCARYRGRLTDRRRLLVSLFPDRDSLPDQHQATVAATWSLSVEQADQLEPVGVARPLLEIASVLDANGIPAEVFSSAAALTLLAARTGRPVEEDDAWDGLGCLQRLNLITWEPLAAPRAVRVHALVQRATREGVPADRAAAVATAVADALVQIWPEIERDTVLSQVLRANVDALDTTAGEHLWSDGCHEVLLRAGRSLGHAGAASAARTYFTALHDVARQHLEPDHPSVLAIRVDLANSRGMAGDATGAVAAYEDVLTDLLRVLGPDDPRVLNTRNNLAFRRGVAGDVAGAAAECEELLADRLRLLGPDHPHTLVTRVNLARWLGESGDVAGAMAALEDVLAERLRALGRDHPETLTTHNSLAFWRGTAGDVAGAVAACEHVLADQLRVLGPDHPDTLVTRGNLAFWRGKAGDVAGAVAACEDLLVDRCRLLGPDHPDTLYTRANIAFFHGEGGDPARAVAGCDAVLADQLRVLGPDHPDTLSTRYDLARWRGEGGDAAGAVAECEAVLADQSRVLGADHPNTLTTRAGLARWRGEGGDVAGAVAAYEAVLTDQLRVLGPDHPSTATTRQDLARWRGELMG